MKFARQHRLPFADARSQTAAILPNGKGKRWSLDGLRDRAGVAARAPAAARVGERGPMVLDTTPRRDAPVSRCSEFDDGAANAFAAKRIRHSIELIGSCMLMAAIVVLALFA